MISSEVKISTSPQEKVTVPPLPTIADAEKLTATYLKDTLRHCQQVGQVMRYFGKKL